MIDTSQAIIRSVSAHHIGKTNGRQELKLSDPPRYRFGSVQDTITLLFPVKL